MDVVFSKLDHALLTEKSSHHAYKRVAVLHVSSDPRKRDGHTCPTRIVFMENFAAMHLGQQLLRLPPLKERGQPHAASTTPEHALCRLYPALCLSRLRGPERRCMQLASRAVRLHHPRDHTLSHGQYTSEDSP